jgi:hypothetical protein
MGYKNISENYVFKYELQILAVEYNNLNYLNRYLFHIYLFKIKLQ